MKKLLLIFSALVFALALSGCDLIGGGGDDDDDPGVTGVTINGLEDATFYTEAVVDLLDGVTVTADDGNDYTSELTVDSDNCTVASDNTLTSMIPAACVINYTAVVDGTFVRESITITFEAEPVIIDDDAPLVAGWYFDSEDDLAGWGTYFLAPGGFNSETVEDGAWKLDITAGNNVWETRKDYMGLPLQIGVDYQVSFRAKSSVDGKKINVQMGQLLASSPWFIDFKPGQTTHFTLGTDWQEYSFSFTMAEDNQDGGILFEMGDLEGSMDIDAIIWLDDIEIRGGSGEDLVGPTIEGVDDTTIFIGDVTEFDPLEGVTATDLVDGTVTDQIVLSGDQVWTVSLPVTYLINYTVSDAAGNTTTVTRVVTFKYDTEAPVLTGVDAVVLQVGTPFDPLAGVAAVDNRDGDVTADIVVGGDTVDVDTAGQYTVTYTIEDEKGNSVTVDRLVTVSAMIFEPTNLIANGDFNVRYWNTWMADWNSTSATVTYDGSVVQLDIADVGAENWNIQLFQEGLSMVNGTQYRVTFDAMSSVDRDINVKIIAADATEFTQTVSLTSTMQTFTFDLTFNIADQGVKLDFELGGAQGGITTAVPSVVTFDNVSVEEFDGTDVVANTDQIMNGDFSVSDNLLGWTSWSRDWEPVITSSLAEEWNELVFRYDGVGDAGWNNQINYEGLEFEYGATYRISFRAKGDAARDFVVNVWDGATNFGSDPLALTTEFVEYSHIFTYNGAETAKVEFQLGLVTENSDGSVFYLDDVLIEKLVQEPVLFNGTFDVPAGWTNWSADWLGLSSSISLMDEALLFTYGGGAGEASWNHQLNYENITFTPGTQYKITFMAKGDAARDFKVNVWDADNSIGHDSPAMALTTDWAAYEYIFTYNAAADNSAKLEFQLGLVTTGDTGTMFYLDDVVLTEWDGSAAVGDNMVMNGTFDQPVGWYSFIDTQAWSGGVAEANLTVVDGELEFDVVQAGGAGWAIQLIQDIELTEGVTYTVEFDAYADATRTINSVVGYTGADNAWFEWGGYSAGTTPLEITDTVATYSFTFVAGNAGDYQVVFKIEAGGDLNNVYVDNVIIYPNYN